jgi:hypothetical protein
MLETLDQLIVHAKIPSKPLAILVSLLYAKSLFKTKASIRMFELLQKQYVKTPEFASLLYYYGKSVVKMLSQEMRQLRQLLDPRDQMDLELD